MWTSLGRVNVGTPGVLVRATVNQADPTARFPINAILFQADPLNVGKIYIFSDPAGVTATRAGMVAVLGVPTPTVIPSASASIPSAPEGFNARDFYVDADMPGDGVIISAVEI